jgi:hypothetical protein
MFDQMVPLSVERHAKQRVRHSTSLRFARKFHIAYITLHEFTRAGAIYPLVFVADKQTGGYRSVALMGLSAGENLFVNETGRWQASYIPAMIRRYPFALSQSKDSDQFIVCVDESSSLLSESEGAPLFDDQGQATETLENVKRYLSELQAMDRATRGLCAFLQAHDLLVPFNLRVNASAQLRKIDGCLVVSEERFNALPDEVIAEMRQKRYLAAVYAHLMSLAQVERLVELNRRRDATAPGRKRKPTVRHVNRAPSATH